MRSILLICLLLCLTGSAFGMGCDVVLVKYSHGCAEADSAFCWHRGDPVHVGPIVPPDSSHCPWGKQVCPETADGVCRFVIITITDVTVEQARNWLGKHLFDENGNPIRMRHRRLVWQALPVAVKIQLRDTGRYTTTWEAIRQFIRNMQTGGMEE